MLSKFGLLPRLLLAGVLALGSNAYAQFPTVESVTLSQIGANTTTHPIAYPATVNAGDLLIILHANDGPSDNVSNWNTCGFESNVLKNTAGTSGANFAYKFASGSETGTCDLTVTSNEHGVAYMLRISGMHASQAPEVSTGSTGTTGDIDPDSVTATWGSADNLFIAIGIKSQNNLASAYPTNYTGNNNSDFSGDVTFAVSISIATRNLAAASDDPGVFTIAGADDWMGFTMVVRPAAAAGGSALPKIMQQQAANDSQYDQRLVVNQR